MGHYAPSALLLICYHPPCQEAYYPPWEGEALITIFLSFLQTSRQKKNEAAIPTNQLEQKSTGNEKNLELKKKNRIFADSS